MIALIIGMLVSLIVTLVGTPLLIRLVHKLHYGQYIRQDGPQSHLVKRGTPTLGGVVINFAILLGWASSALYRYLRSGDVPSWSAALVLFAMLSMGLLGFIDDFAKVRKKQNEGLSVGGKFIGQFIFATIYAVLALLIPTKSGFPSAQAGISFEILCCAVHDAAKKTLKLLHGNDEQLAKIRLAELLEAQAAVLPSEMPRLSEFQSKVAMVQKAYKADEATEAMRRLTSLDPARLATHPDIVTVYLVRGDEAEAVQVLLKEVREVNIIGTLLSEPQAATGLHKGDVISFFLVRNEKGIMCMKVLEK